MDKCRLANDLSEEDANITAFPKDDTVDLESEEDSESPSIVPNQADSDAPHDVIDTSHVDGRGGGKQPDMSSSVATKNKVNKKNRYFLRSKL